MRTLLPLLILFPLSARAGDAEKKGAKVTPAPLTEDMRTHWDYATNARDGVIQADLESARKWGRDLAALPAPDGLSPSWRPLYDDMQRAAKQVAEAANLPEAGERVGALALTCAECHDFTGGGPGHLILPLPNQDFTGSDSDMPMHQWCADWMWIGLIANDTEAWKRGADALLERPFRRTPGDEESQHNEQIVHLVASLAEPGDRASQAKRYARVITACAECHTDATEKGQKQP